MSKTEKAAVDAVVVLASSRERLRVFQPLVAPVAHWDLRWRWELWALRWECCVARCALRGHQGASPRRPAGPSRVASGRGRSETGSGRVVSGRVGVGQASDRVGDQLGQNKCQHGRVSSVARFKTCAFQRVPLRKPRVSSPGFETRVSGFALRQRFRGLLRQACVLRRRRCAAGGRR